MSRKILTPDFTARRRENPTPSENTNVIGFVRSPPELDCFIPMVRYQQWEKTRSQKDWLRYLEAVEKENLRLENERKKRGEK